MLRTEGNPLRSSLARALGQGGSVSAVAPAPCIGTAWAPRTSRAAFPVTASAFAIAWDDTQSSASLANSRPLSHGPSTLGDPVSPPFEATRPRLAPGAGHVAGRSAGA